MQTTFLRIALLLCALLLAVPPGLRAQASDVSTGTRVRLVDPVSGQIVGTVTELRGDSLVVRSGKGDRERLVTLSISSLRRLQVSEGRPSRPLSALQGAGQGALGGAIGGVLGATGASLLSGGCDRTDDEDLCIPTGLWALIGLYFGATQGALWGAGIGFVFPQERWRTVPIRNPPVVTLGSARGGVQVGISIPLP